MDTPESDIAPDSASGQTPRRGAAGRLADQLKSRSGQLTDAGLAKVAEFAEAKKDDAVERLDAVTGIVRDLADAAGERFGAPVGNFVHRGSDALDAVSQRIARESIEDISGTARNAIVRNPAIALAAVSVAGFFVGRIVKGGLAQSAGRRSSGAATNAVEAAA